MKKYLKIKSPSLEEGAETLNFKLSKGDIDEQIFAIDFVDYHEVIIRKYRK
jgi:hypothetical protein